MANYYVLRVKVQKDGTEKLGTMMPKDTWEEAKQKLWSNLVEDTADENLVGGKVIIFDKDFVPIKPETWGSLDTER